VDCAAPPGQTHGYVAGEIAVRGSRAFHHHLGRIGWLGQRWEQVFRSASQQALELGFHVGTCLELELTAAILPDLDLRFVL
jgi:hypothetical protein